MTTDAEKTHDEFRAKLLEAAGEVFAEVGFGRATIRQIVERAGASLGSVNYHFGDKDELYRKVLGQAHQQTIEQFREAADKPTAPEQLEGYVHVLLSHVLGSGSNAWPGRVLCNELGELISQHGRGKSQGGRKASGEQKGQGERLRRFIQPRLGILMDIVRELLGPTASEELVVRHTMSVVGQCIYYLRSRAAAEAIYERRLGEADIEPLTAHITRVSLAGIDAERSTSSRLKSASPKKTKASSR